jgi:hypothetical protein
VREALAAGCVKMRASAADSSLPSISGCPSFLSDAIGSFGRRGACNVGLAAADATRGRMELVLLSQRDYRGVHYEHGAK